MNHDWIQEAARELRDHYNTDWDSTVPGKEFDEEIVRIISRHLSVTEQGKLRTALHTSNTALRHLSEGGRLPKSYTEELSEIVAENDRALSPTSDANKESK